MSARSKIASLPEPIRQELDKRLIAAGFGNYSDLAAWLESEGYEIGRSSIHRYGSPLEHRIEQVRLSTQAAETLVEAAGDDKGALADASLRLIQQRIYDVMLASDDGDLRSLSGAARALADTARAGTAVRQERRKVLKDAAEAVGDVARACGISTETESAIRAAIEGA